MHNLYKGLHPDFLVWRPPPSRSVQPATNKVTITSPLQQSQDSGPLHLSSHPVLLAYSLTQVASQRLCLLLLDTELRVVLAGPSQPAPPLPPSALQTDLALTDY